MTTDKIRSDRERCIAYLLGEAGPDEAAAFEAELNDPTLAEMLLQESNLLAGIAEAPALARPMETATVSSTGVSVRRLVAYVSVLAAAILIAVNAQWLVPQRLLPQGENANTQVALNTEPSLELSIARAWASQSLQLADIDAAGITDGSSVDESDLGSDLDSPESVDWMVVAVQASFDSEDQDG